MGARGLAENCGFTPSDPTKHNVVGDIALEGTRPFKILDLLLRLLIHVNKDFVICICKNLISACHLAVSGH